MTRAPSRPALLASIALLALGTAAGVGLYRLGLRQGAAEHPAAATALPGETVATRAVARAVPPSAASAASAGRRILYWHDPMVPGPRFDKPGKSPFMDMQLVPVYADEAPAGEAAGVHIDPRVQQNLGMRTAEVVRGVLAPPLEATGTVAWNERDAAVVAARAGGFVERLHVRAPFDRVARGQTLAELYVPDWVAAQEEFLALARMRGPDLEPLLEASRARMRQAGMSEAQIARVASAGTLQPRLALTAPIDGVVAEVGVREGAAVAMGAPLLRINGLSTVWLLARVPESLASQLRTNQAVEAITAAGMRVSGKVGALLPTVDAATRTLEVRIELPNADGALVPGMFARVRFVPAAREEALLVPSEAVIVTGQRALVMRAQADGRFVPVEVERGLEAGGRTEIRRGLQAGDRVVLSGQFLLDAEASLKGVEARQGVPAPGGAETEPAASGAR